MKKSVFWCLIVVCLSIMLCIASIYGLNYRLRKIEAIQAEKEMRYELAVDAYEKEAWIAVGYNRAVLDSAYGKLSYKEWPEEPKREDYL